MGMDCPVREGWLGKEAGPTGLTAAGPNGLDCDTATNEKERVSASLYLMCELLLMLSFMLLSLPFSKPYPRISTSGVSP